MIISAKKGEKMAVEIKDGCKIQFKLQAQSPMIHFQADEPGATLRGSEVKPKLDRFLIRKLLISEFGKDDPANFAEIKKRHGDYFIDPEHDALDYKISFADNRGRSVPLDTYSIYCWNNMGVPENEKKKGLGTTEQRNTRKDGDKVPENEKKKGLWTDPECSILCFNENLIELIRNNIEAFFLVTNFGTMQDKGFGSFLPETLGFGESLGDKEKKIVAECLNMETGRTNCYIIEFKNNSKEEITKKVKKRNGWEPCPTNYAATMFDEVKMFYSILKSGYNFRGYSRSYLFQYMHKYCKINNEKAWMKQTGIMTVKSKPGNEKKYDRQDKDPKYLRAFLGTGETMDIKNNKIKIKGENRERVQSTMLFKVISNCVFISCYDIPDDMYDTTFTFTGNNKTMPINTPAKEQLKNFSIDDLLEKYVDYFNKIIKHDKVEINGTINQITDKDFDVFRPVTAIGGENR